MNIEITIVNWILIETGIFLEIIRIDINERIMIKITSSKLIFKGETNLLPRYMPSVKNPAQRI